jgi:Ser/Thr protein kinase RdoA (MazF antagonist)
VSTLDPAPSWAAWNHGGNGLWPPAEDSDVDLDAVSAAEWIDEAGRRALDRLRAGDSEAVIGHCDWLAGNLRWDGDTPLVVHDWDSVVVDSEAVLAGFAAALFSTVSADGLATVEETERFLDAYCLARGREFSAGELQRAWAAGVWTRAYDARYQHAIGQPITSLSEDEARERLRRADAGGVCGIAAKTGGRVEDSHLLFHPEPHLTSHPCQTSPASRISPEQPTSSTG